MFHVRASPSLTRALRLVEHDHHLTKDDKRLIKALIEGYAMPVPERTNNAATKARSFLTTAQPGELCVNNSYADWKKTTRVAMRKV